jgi:hypothetical protein
LFWLFCFSYIYVYIYIKFSNSFFIYNNYFISRQLDAIQSLSALYHFQAYREKVIHGLQQEQSKKKKLDKDGFAVPLFRKKTSPLFGRSPSTTTLTPTAAVKSDETKNYFEAINSSTVSPLAFSYTPDVPEPSHYFTSSVRTQVKDILMNIPKSTASSQALLEHDARRVLSLIQVPVQRLVWED